MGVWAAADCSTPLANTAQINGAAEKNERASQIMGITGGCEKLESDIYTLLLALTFV